MNRQQNRHDPDLRAGTACVTPPPSGRGRPYGQRRMGLGLALLCVLGALPRAEADELPGVKIRMPRETTPAAVSGQEYSGVIEIVVGEEGALSDFQLRGEGWEVLSLDSPAQQVLSPGEVLRVPFRAMPVDASQIWKAR